ncbi:NmrA family NAD(P)-binding protein [Microlunatus spumicola]|uniref:NmrA family NAD(P)-binding protein n=1 Tax=Microlunatus spumicola TaxID=81499 RepID=A0ABP6XB70_9ACTN
MPSSDTPPVAVVGATGQQGGRVVDALLEAGAPVRALVRDPSSAGARALQARGVELATADQEDGDALARGLGGVGALFFLTTFAGPDGTDGEVRRGTVVAEAAARARVPHVVYSSVGGAERATGIPHFESKRRVEERLTDLVPATFLRPTFFMENLAAQLAPGPDGDVVVRLPMPGDVPLQMVAVRDIGAAAARLLLDPDALAGDAVEIAGDELTLDRVAAEVRDATGRAARFEEVPLAALGDDTDLQAMFRWFASPPAYRADRAATRRLVPDVSDLRTWLGRQAGAGSGN